MFLSQFTSVQVVQISTLVFAITVHLIAFSTTVFQWRRLPQRFRLFSLASTAVLSTAKMESLYFATSYNTLYGCIASRKVLYGLVYAGFFVFDIYQMSKIRAISGAIKPSKLLFGTLFIARLGSYIYNLYYVTGTLIGVSNGLGACKTIFPDDWQIYQEHIISVAFELGLAYQFGKFVQMARVPNMPLQEFVARVVDNEIFSFLIYGVVEILYIIVFQFPIVKQWVSVLNSFYFLIPSTLYLANIFILVGKHGISLKVKKISSGPKVDSTIKKASMQDDSAKALPKSDSKADARDLTTIRKNSTKEDLKTIRKPSVDGSIPIRKMSTAEELELQ
ncbi:hypothetical protein HDV04_003748 [Boothiomyces sp. JEL0838]|nr:hypothetical protein HDV04_003748 [Boothiomyces sp. JEL0838]